MCGRESGMSQPGEQRRYTLGEFFSLAGDERYGAVRRNDCVDVPSSL